MPTAGPIDCLEITATADARRRDLSMIDIVRFCTRKPLCGLLGGLTVLLLTLAQGASALAADAQPATPKPGAVVVQRIHSFGSLVEDTDIKHDFIIENHGSGVLVIHKVEPS
jgi:hypothetical protein